VGVGKPGVDREEGKLDGEGEKKRREEPRRRGMDDGGPGEGRQGEGIDPGLVAVDEIDPDDRQEHQERAGQGVEEELHSRVDPPAVPPDADQEEHRDQHNLPEKVEEEEVEGQEDPHDAAFHHQDEGIVERHPLFDGVP
jgi:hypothetical protein